MVSIGSLGHISMRGRLMILITAAMLPLALFIGISILNDYDRTLMNARRELLQSARIAATLNSQVFVTSRIVLETVRHSIGMADGSGGCRQWLGKVKSSNPQFLSVGVTDDRGAILCHSTTAVQDTFHDVDLVKRILSPDDMDFVVGRLLIMGALNKPTITVGIPMRDETGRRTGVVFANLDLDYLASKTLSHSESGRRIVTVIQPSTGQVLTCHPSCGFKPGTSLVDHPLVEAMRHAPSGGVTEAMGPFGTLRIFGFEPIEGVGLMFAVGESTDSLLSPVLQAALLRSSLGAGLFLTVIALAWWLGRHLYIRPIGRLTHIAALIGSGNYEVRARLEPWQSPELRGLGTALDRMAARLAAAREIEKAVAASEVQYRLLAENTADLVTCVDRQGLRTFASPSSKDVLGYAPEELVGLYPLDSIHPDDRPIIAAMMKTLHGGAPVMGVQYRGRHRDGRYIWLEVNGRPTTGGSSVFSIRDVTERKKTEDELARANRQLAALASTDGLTGLLNRRSFDVLLADAFTSSLAEKRELSLLMIDVDRFKSFNDRYGHLAGDQCLRQVAKTLRSVLRRPGIAVARYGGEEFAVILPDTPLSAAVQAAEALRLSVRRLDIANASSEYGFVTISVGVAAVTAGSDLRDVAELLGRADDTLYAAKAGGRNRINAAFADVAAAS